MPAKVSNEGSNTAAWQHEHVTSLTVTADHGLLAAGGEWGLFVDWCAVTGRIPFPASAATVLGFLGACAAAPATLRRRLTAIDQHHRAHGYEPPERTPEIRDLVRGRPARQVRQTLDPERVEAALRVLPVHGWTNGWFGRRDRALLVLAAAGLPYTQIGRFTAGNIYITAGRVVVTTAAGNMELLAGDDPMVCGPCALAQWLRALNIEAGRAGHRVIARALKRAHPLTSKTRHQCQLPTTALEHTQGVALFPPIDQHGYTPLERAPMSVRSLSALAREKEAGHHVIHKTTPAEADPPTDDQSVPMVEVAPVRRYTVEDWRRGVAQRHSAQAALADVGDTFDELERRIADLEQRTRDLLKVGE